MNSNLEMNSNSDSESKSNTDADSSEILASTNYADEYVKAEEKRHYEASLENAVTDVVADDTASDDINRLIEKYNFVTLEKDNLAISELKDKVLSLIETNPIVIIRGPTGCGKTTRVPQYILDKCFEAKVACNIIVTQPRRIAAMSIAERVCSERKWPLGSLVGYKVGQDYRTSVDTRLTFCTTGVLLNRLVKKKNLDGLTHIIIDEVHERDQDTDFLLLIARKLVRSNPGSVKLILMSATINVDKFSKYFSFYVGDKSMDAPVFDIVNTNFFKVEDLYLEDINGIEGQPKIRADYPSVATEMFTYGKELISSLIKIDETSRSDGEKILDLPTVLVFLPGLCEIGEMHKALNDSTHRNLDIITLHSTSSREDRKKIFEAPILGKRKVILATNIAESSLTVPNVKYVIDFCLTKLLVTDPETNFPSLVLTWSSKASCQQRAGRTGRVMDGFVYRLVPKKFYEQSLPEENLPEMQRTPLTNVILKAKVLDIEKPLALLALCLEPPDLKNITQSILLLEELGALIRVEDDPCDGELTDFGRAMAQVPLDIRISRMILLGHAFSILDDAIIMGASMVSKSMFSTSFSKKFKTYKAKLECAGNSASDILTFRNVYQTWKSKKANWKKKKNKHFEEREWAWKNSIEVRVLREIEATVEELTVRFSKLGVRDSFGNYRRIWTAEQKELVLKTVIAGAFYPQYYSTNLSDEKKNFPKSNYPDPTKVVYLTNWPRSQPGIIYAKRFADALSDCLNHQFERISIKFDDFNRVLIQFEECEYPVDSWESAGPIYQMPGRISPAVYLAVKMGVIDGKISIPVLNESRSNAFAERKNIQNNYPYFINNFVEPPSGAYCTSNIEVRGPFSPLKMNLEALTISGANKRVTVHSSSVNSIILDSSLQNKPRLVVAGNVSTRPAMGRHTSQLSIRETTLMPDIPGLTSLMALIFAPKIELRCDQYETRYTGVLCGLGYDPQTKRSLFPEHDMYLDFDVDITNQDLKAINNLRDAINLVISQALDLSATRDEAITIPQEYVKDHFLEIFRKNRVPVPHDAPTNCHQWYLYDSSMFIDSQLGESDKQVFKSHSMLNFEEKRINVQEMMIHNSITVRQMCGEQYQIQNENNNPDECKLCNMRFAGIFALQTHLMSTEHHMRELEFSSFFM